MEKVEEYLFPNMQPHEREHLASRNWDINTELFEGDVDKKKEALMKIIEGKNKESIMEKVAS